MKVIRVDEIGIAEINLNIPANIRYRNVGV